MVKEDRGKGLKFLLIQENIAGDPLLGYADSEKNAKALRKLIAGLEVKIVLYLRRQDQLIESLYTQYIQQGESWTFQEFVDQFTLGEHFDWERVTTSFVSEFGKENLVVRRYGKAYLPERKCLLMEFAEMIGSASLKNLQLAEMKSVFYSRAALEIARLCNSALN